MTRTLSLGLDALRFFAAFAVVLGHTATVHITGWHEKSVAWQNYANDAVVFFFVLSGLVIRYVQNRYPTLSDYTIARIARLWSVLIPAIFLTLISSYITYLVNAEYYQDWNQPLKKTLICPVVDLAFMNESWGKDCAFGSNFAVWSLGYEATYYLLFGLLFFLNGWQRVVSVALVALVKGPGVMILFPLWLFGLWLYDVTVKSKPDGRIGGALVAISIGLYVLVDAIWRVGIQDWIRAVNGPEWNAILGKSDLYPWRYFVALCTGGLVLGIHHLSASQTIEKALVWAKTPIRIAANTSFTTYLFHTPILVLLSLLVPRPMPSAAGVVGLAVTTTAITTFVGYYLEAQKHHFKPLAAALVTRLAALAPKRVAAEPSS